MGDEPATFGQWLKRSRRAHKLTQRKLASEMGIDFTYLSKLENDLEGQSPSEDLVRRLAERLGHDAERVLVLARKIPIELKELANRDVDVARLLRKLPGMPPDQLRRVIEAADD